MDRKGGPERKRNSRQKEGLRESQQTEIRPERESAIMRKKGTDTTDGSYIFTDLQQKQQQHCLHVP